MKKNKFYVFMVILTALIISISISYETSIAGCAGDCMTCHPKLVGDYQHKSLTTCIKCHKPASEKRFSLSNGGCGDRCFQCHSEFPKDSYHSPLDSCLNCHEK